ncbi:FAD-dependent thymidylate synthase [Thermosulfurimonas dismutans]|uniref:Thymidylate synthase thyX n=1 Tax=Thermosulfurimonas dismutans TaxID=999894 RepID=A0A179D6B3_9BACT|nr:FAD-dependent thymidylate synthase [Thermosulfurimonas dismutans]OAQ21634.1 hypothetical protein TDIS_0152 [Thermosulfurimonas dismutans]
MKDLRAVYYSKQKALIHEIFQELGGEAFRKTLFLSFLGARICYAETPPLSLFAEERFRDPEKLKAFFLRLKSAGHGSVFAHSPLIWEFKSGDPDPELLASLYKAWFDPESRKLQLNLRHFAEVMEDGDFEALIGPGVMDESFLEFEAWYLEGAELKLIFSGALKDLLPRFENLRETDLLATRRVTVIRVPETEPFGWYAVIVEGFSRIFSHQFVRHTWLNFNQRSHRYTSVDQFVIPPSFEKAPEARELYREEIERGLSAYRALISSGVKKEDARFLTPQGASTTVLATGPYFVWKDFVEKRAHPKAQWEIRLLAEALKSYL